MEDGSLVTGKNTGHPTPWCYGCALWTQKGVSGHDAGGSKRFSPRKAPGREGPERATNAYQLQGLCIIGLGFRGLVLGFRGLGLIWGPG